MTESNRRTIERALQMFRKAGVNEHVIAEAECILQAEAAKIGTAHKRVKLPSVPAVVEFNPTDRPPHWILVENGPALLDQMLGRYDRPPL